MTVLEQLRFEELDTRLAAMGLQHWSESLRPLCETRLSAHGDIELPLICGRRF